MGSLIAEPIFDQKLYLPSEKVVLETIEQHLDRFEGNLILVGHNPAWSEVCSQLANQPIGLSTAQGGFFTKEPDTTHGEWRLDSIISPN